jgi:hypothetical protein
MRIFVAKYVALEQVKFGNLCPTSFNNPAFQNFPSMHDKRIAKV